MRSVCLLCRSYLLREQTSTISPPPPPKLTSTAQKILQLAKLAKSAPDNPDDRNDNCSDGIRQSCAHGEHANYFRDTTFSSRLCKKKLQLLPPCRFPGETVHIKHPNMEKDYTDTIFQLLRSHVLGFDVECLLTCTRPVLVQLASRELCVMWHVNKKESFPVLLHGILSSPHYLKVGHGSFGDARALLGYYAINTINFFDTHTFLTSLPEPLRPPLLNLQGLVGIFLGRWLSKAMTRSNWNKRVLSEKQLLYASADVWASLEVYLALMEYASQLEISTPPPVECTLSTCKPHLIKSMEAALRDSITQAEQARLAMQRLRRIDTDPVTSRPASFEQLDTTPELECALNTIQRNII